LLGWSCGIANAPGWRTASAPPRPPGWATSPSICCAVTPSGWSWSWPPKTSCWAQALLLDGELAVAEPKALRYRLLHVAARIIRHARRIVLRLQRRWPWAAALAQAFTRLRALPLRC
jgi:hypothetical protein